MALEDSFNEVMKEMMKKMPMGGIISGVGIYVPDDQVQDPIKEIEDGKTIELSDEDFTVTSEPCDDTSEANPNPRAKYPRVLVVEPGKKPYVRGIEDTLEELQALVGGNIEMVLPFDDRCAIICNREGKLSGLPANRKLYDFNGDFVDILVGTFLVVAVGEDGETADMTDEEIDKYMEVFAQ